MNDNIDYITRAVEALDEDERHLTIIRDGNNDWTAKCGSFETGGMSPESAVQMLAEVVKSRVTELKKRLMHV